MELSSSQPPRLLLVRTRSLARSRTEEEEEEEEEEAEEEEILDLEEDFEVLAIFQGTQAELRRVGKFSFVALIIRKTHLVFSSKAFPYFFFFFLLSLAISALSRNQLIFLSLSCFWLMGFYLFIS